jgi:hypothetical protein
MLSRQIHEQVGGGSPDTSTDHLCVRPALMVTLLKVARSILGFTEKQIIIIITEYKFAYKFCLKSVCLNIKTGLFIE